ncbi:MAG: hypothetical protein IKI67_06765 [Bacteroidales bacterium]|nr:hypothetical protein [Bacteroidales bacterium]
MAKGVQISILGAAMMLLALFSTKAFAQFGESQNRDTLVRLVSAKSAQLVEQYGRPFRNITGPAKFLHNNTYLLCDSASWDVNDNIIYAIGNVKIMQKNTYLVSEEAAYLVDEDLAQFRGGVVRLYNKKGDELKTYNLDYNTRDSIANFFDGGAMLSKKGELIEGNEGMYDSENKTFLFTEQVQMYADSLFTISDWVEYNSEREVAMFGENTVAWYGRDTLFTNDGEYSTASEYLVLKRDNYIATQNQEVWGEEMHYHRSTGNAELYNNVQIRDNEQSAILMGDKGIYERNPMVALLTNDAAAAMYSQEKSGEDTYGRPIYKRDTLFISGDTLRMKMLEMGDIAESEITASKNRRKLADLDPMVEIDKNNKKWLEAYKRNKEMLGKPQPPPKTKQRDTVASDLTPPADSLKIARVDSLKRTLSDSLKVSPSDSLKEPLSDSLKVSLSDSLKLSLSDSLKVSLSDSLKVSTDSVAVQKDTTKVTFIDAYKKVKIFRSDLRGVCDSLIYNSIDSIARFYTNPALWNDETTQFTADSMHLSIRNNEIYKANFIENAYIIQQEDSVHFNQIKSTEMVAYFKDNDVYRFDALGGVQAMLFIRERDEEITLMNQKECKLLTARMKDNAIERVRYIENIKSDVMPTYNLDVQKKRLRDFNWRIDEMPINRQEVTKRVVKPSNRGSLKKIRFPRFIQTEIFFPNMHKTVTSVAAQIRERISSEDQERQNQNKQ